MTAGRGPRKSERTRAAILAAARRLFAENGYDRTSVRDVAAAAGADPALVVRYFGGKDRLFAEAASIALDLPDLDGVPRDEVGPCLARHFIALWEEDAGGGGLPILLRSAASNEVAAETMRGVFTEQVLPAVRRLGPAAGAEERAALVASLLLGAALCRYILRLPPMADLPKDRLATLLGGAVGAALAGGDRGDRT